MSRFRPYVDYVDCDIEWMNQAPAHWTISRVQDIGKIMNGHPFDAKLFNSDGKYPLVRIRDLNSECTATRYDGEFIASAAIDSSDVLIGMDGDFNVGQWRGNGKALLNQRMCCVRTEDPNLTSFLAYLLPTPLKVINDTTYSTTVKHLSSSGVQKIKLALPPKDELNQILKLLDREITRIDTLIAKKTRFIELLKEKRQAVIAKAVTKGLDDSVEMKDSGLAWLPKVPAHWEVRRMASLFREAVRPGDPSLPILSISIHDGITDEELAAEDRDRRVTQIEDRSKYKRVKPNDLAYNMMRAWQGAFGTVAVEGLVSPAYVVAEPIEDLDTGYIEQLLRTPMAVEEMRRYSRGIADFRMRLYWEYFRDLKVCLPPVVEQKEILERIRRATTRIDLLVAKTERSIELLKEHRAALITAAVTGKIDVREAA